MIIVLDTHAWIWWVSDPELLSAEACDLIEQAVEAGSVHISCISAWEVDMLVDRGRLELTMAVEDWVAKSESLPFFSISCRSPTPSPSSLSPFRRHSTTILRTESSSPRPWPWVPPWSRGTRRSTPIRM